MNIKSAILISSSLLLLTTPVLAIDRQVNITTRIASKEANIQQKIGTMEQRKLAEASKAAMYRQKLMGRKEFIASHEAQIKIKMQAFKDKQKAEIAIRVNTNLNKINQNQTDQMLKHLDKMTALLDKLQERVSSKSPDVKDPAAANQAISDAREAVANAKTAVQAQAQKDYTITVTTETKIKLDAQSKRDELHKDIMVVRTLAIAAKQSVSNAVKVAKSSAKEATRSGQQ